MKDNLGRLERGRIAGATDAGYIVESLDRDGIVSPPISPVYSQVYEIGDIVMFVLFRDGTGKIISGQDGGDIPTGRDGEPATVLRIDSSRGTAFKNNMVFTVLSIAIYRGPDRITDIDTLHRIFGISAYLQWSWLRMGDDHYGIISADDPRIGNGGFTLTISPADVDTKVTFMCELII